MNIHASASLARAPRRPRQIGWMLSISALILAACGGAPEVAVIDTSEPKASVPTPSTPPATVLAGLYKGYFDDKTNREFLALVVPARAETVKVYGWYFGAADSRLAQLYSGELELGIQGNASNVPQSWKVSEGDSFPYSADASATTGSLSNLLTTLSVSRSSVGNYRLAADALATASYNFNTNPINLGVSPFNGFWSSKTSVLGGGLLLSTTGTPDVSDTAWDCFKNGTPPTWTWAAQTSNYFKVTLSLGSITNCEWQNKSLEGVAVVSRQNGRDQLDMMLLDGTGAGISYRGTR